MTPTEVLGLMLAEVDPIPVGAAIDLVREHAEGTVELTDAVYLLFMAAGEMLARDLGPCPESAPPGGNSSARCEGVERLRDAWQYAHGIVDRVRGNYVSHHQVTLFRERLRQVPGLNVIGISGAIQKMAYERWADTASKLCRVMEEVENIESEVLSIPQPSPKE